MSSLEQVEQKACLVCGEKTRNPRFCSRSCAAKYNNKANPKRRPEGHCLECRTVISTRKSYCDKCASKLRAKHEREMQRKTQNIRSWRAVSGSYAEAPIEDIHTSKTVVFENRSGWMRSRLTPKDKAGVFIDRLIGICFATPAYLRSVHAPRHIALLNELKEFSFTRHHWKAKPETVLVADLPIVELSPALNEWIFSYFAEEHHALMPSFALDTARFLQAHLEGDAAYRSIHWRIEPMVSGVDRDILRFIDRQFKKEFTERMGKLLFCARVPDNSRVVDGSGIEVIASGTAFLFGTKRCHLSSGVYDSVILQCEEKPEFEFDLHDEFRFMGGIFGFHRPDGYVLAKKEIFFQPPEDRPPMDELRSVVQNLDYHGLAMELPAHWIESVIDIPFKFYFDASEQPRIMDVPRWEAELEAR